MLLQVQGFGRPEIERGLAQVEKIHAVRRMSAVWTPSVHFLDSAYNSGARAAQTAAAGKVARWRSVLLSRPGVVVELAAPPSIPSGLCAATAAIASTLFDQDTRVWLSPTLDCSSVRKYLRSQTGSIRVTEPTLADFGVVARPGELPPLGSFHRGTEADPSRSTVLVVQVDSLDGKGSLQLSGPGMNRVVSIAAKGIGDAFLSEWAHNACLFPRGVDVFLTCGRWLCFLPRALHIDV